MRRVVVLATVLFIIVSICHAQSSKNPAIEYLLKDKATMLDVGLLRLEQVAQRYLESAYSFSELWIIAKYSLKKDLIILNLFINPTHQSQNNREEIRYHSRKAITYLRDSLSNEILEACFGHGELFQDNYPKGFWETFRGNFYVEVDAPYRGGKSKQPGRIKCKGNLSSEGKIVCE